MRPYSCDLRQKIVDLYNNGEGSIRQLAHRFAVSPGCVQRLLKQERETHSIAPKAYVGGPKPTLQQQHLQVLEQLVQVDNDATLVQLATRLQQQTQLQVSGSTISRALKKLGITQKKSLKAAEVYDDSHQQQRLEYWNLIGNINPYNLVFLDETGVNLAIVKAYGRALKGQRAYGKQPKAAGKNVSIIGVMSLAVGFLSGLSFEGGTPGDLFLWFVETILCPCLWTGAVVVMDNLPAHKVAGVTAAIEAVGARVIYLSPYSPDFNPIENLWSKLKEFLRAAEARTSETLHQAIAQGLEQITLEDVRSWFTHACYCT